MKKILTLICALTLLFVLAVPTAAAHTHYWDFTIEEEVVNLFCYCSSKVIIPLNEEANYCDHNFTEFYTNKGHGEECETCGFIKLDAHDLVHLTRNDEHFIYCRKCDYEESHDAVSYHDEYIHYVECYECNEIFEHTMSAYDVDENYHYYECDECSYYIREAHTYNDEGFCIECQLFSGFITNITELDDVYEVEVLVNDTYFYYDTSCDMEKIELNSLINFMVFDGEIVEISTVLSTSNLEDHDYLEEFFEIGKVSEDFMYEFKNEESFDDSDVFLFNIKRGHYCVRSNTEILLYKPVNPHLLPIVVT